MYVTINPKKVRRFTTKGIHLTLRNPVGYVPESLEPEFMSKISQAIRDEHLIVVPDDASMGILVPGVGQTEGARDSDEQSLGDVEADRKPVEDSEFSFKDPFGNTIRARKMKVTVKLPEREVCSICGNPDCEGTHMKRPEEPLIVLTDRD